MRPAVTTSPEIRRSGGRPAALPSWNYARRKGARERTAAHPIARNQRPSMVHHHRPASFSVAARLQPSSHNESGQGAAAAGQFGAIVRRKRAASAQPCTRRRPASAPPCASSCARTSNKAPPITPPQASKHRPIKRNVERPARKSRARVRARSRGSVACGGGVAEVR
ncbi:hypothetical protein F511_46883 [Dorcoceras hygrometricum]|uniref:Uncharacterized protein n=1 Tax=Dorcoceras hygrometricum TaxID=472368 RepID=A0A2Z6ZSH0_9LAMI|nr:hypothetical protein F511_46883 [Dorcoceras hygrometricum]